MPSRSRRDFLGAAVTLLAASALSARSLAAQSQIPMPMPGANSPFPRLPDPLGEPLPGRPANPAEHLKKNQEEIKKDMGRLQQLVSDLQKDLDANGSSKVLSISAVRKTEEIEKLARDIRGLMRG